MGQAAGRQGDSGQASQPRRRVAAHWHKNHKSLDVVIGPLHVTVSPEEASSLQGQLAVLLRTPVASE